MKTTTNTRMRKTNLTAAPLFQKRLTHLKMSLEALSCDGMLVEDAINIYYMTGLSVSSGKLLIHPGGAHLLVDSRYIEHAKNFSPFPVVLYEGPQTYWNVFSKFPETEWKTLGFNADQMTYRTFQQLQKDIVDFNVSSGRNMQLKPLDNPIAKLRMVKDAGEITVLRQAAELGSEGFDFVCSLLKEGVSEAELAVELEVFWKRRGGKTLAFDPIIAFGANSSMPHYRVGKSKLSKGQSVLIDIGVNYQHYHSDMTRVVYFGKPDPKLLAIHAVVQEAQQLALEACKPGVTAGELDACARSWIAKKGYGEHFTHSLGHGVGLEIHEAPTLRNKPPYDEVVLQPGMVITIEPGIYLPGLGGVRIEDTVVITDGGCENLTLRAKAPVQY